MRLPGSHADLKLPDGRQRVVRQGMIRFARSRRELGRSRWKSPRRGIAGLRAPRSASAIRRRSCRNGRGARKASTFFCRRFTCAAFHRRLSGSADGLAWQGRANLSPAVIARLKANGKTNTSSGKNAICRLGAMFMSGPRRLSASAHGAASRMHVGADRRDARGQEGVARLSTGMRESAQSWKECSSI